MLPDSMRVRLFGDFLPTSSLQIQPFREEQGVRGNDCIRRLPNSIRQLHSYRNTFLGTDEQHIFPFRDAEALFTKLFLKTSKKQSKEGFILVNSVDLA